MNALNSRSSRAAPSAHPTNAAQHQQLPNNTAAQPPQQRYPRQIPRPPPPHQRPSGDLPQLPPRALYIVNLPPPAPPSYEDVVNEVPTAPPAEEVSPKKP
ncbi:unnamed protein product [Hymenolepis diminuta]|uniref:Uncharacterized protein n=1 Tax=Hymenolepis diminuta TaxID=6216 RepID=A0A0R3SXI3_HYMDI|nr:unnamed protein product [Hymenolepis diminuta]